MTSASDIRKLFEGYLESHPLGEEPRTLYEPTHYIMSLGGKRMRPVLLLMAFGLWNETPDEALPAALAIEVFHNFSLVHDDIMDEAMVRRGKEAVHIRYGQNTAILSGDVMLIRSFDLLLQSCHDANALEVMETMTQTCARICEGQQLDLDFESMDIVSVNDYIHMNRLKTAELLAASLRIGALLAGAPMLEAIKLYDAGIALGQAFQIQDDVLDAYGDEGVIGKKRGGDILHAKKTILYTLLLEQLPDKSKQTFIDLYKEQASNPEVKIQQVLRWFDRHGIRKTADARCTQLYQTGLQLIAEVEGSSVGKALLADYVEQLLVRKL